MLPHHLTQKGTPMKLFLAVLMLLLIALPVSAARRKCPPTCKHRRQPVCVVHAPTAAPAPALAPTLWDHVVQGFGIRAGFRWEREHVCPTCPAPVPCYTPPPPAPPTEEPGYRDPFFVGAELRLPLARGVQVFGAWDRDFTERANHQTTVGVVMAPWSRR